MIVGLGNDVAAHMRIEKLHARFGQALEKRLFTARERILFAQRKQSLARMALAVAAKEAAVKALGTGFREGIGWQHIEVLRDSSGAPMLLFHGPARERLLTLAPPGLEVWPHLSLSDEAGLAFAVVVLEAR